MKESGFPLAACFILLAVLLPACLALSAYGRPADVTLVTFLKHISDFGRTQDELAARLGEPDVVTHDTAGHSVTRYYYAGLEAAFDNLSGDIIVLAVTDSAWTVDMAVGIGATKEAVDFALGDDYCRIVGDGNSEVRVYFCPRPHRDADARRCDNCRLCYIFFEDDRASKIEWSTEILDGY